LLFERLWKVVEHRLFVAAMLERVRARGVGTNMTRSKEYQIHVQNLFDPCERWRGVELRLERETGGLHLVREDDGKAWWSDEASVLEAIVAILALKQDGDRLIYFDKDHIGQGYALVRADHSRNIDRYFVTRHAPVP
jgi:hypothetical protein